MMQVRGRITTAHADPACAAGSLAPDNLSSMQTREEGGRVSTSVESGALRSVIASVDDYLMNLEIAEDICSCVLH
jgi:hypothetical protein